MIKTIQSPNPSDGKKRKSTFFRNIQADSSYQQNAHFAQLVCILGDATMISLRILIELQGCCWPFGFGVFSFEEQSSSILVGMP